MANAKRTTKKPRTTSRHSIKNLKRWLEAKLTGDIHLTYPDGPLHPGLLRRAVREAPTLNPTEALMGFAGWLTTRDKPVILSSHHDAAPVVELIKIFTKEYELPDVRDDWPNRLKNMSDVATNLTNDPALNPNQVAPAPPTFEEAYDKIRVLFHFFPDQRQNHLLARLVEDLKDRRVAEFSYLTEHIERQTERHAQLADATKELDQVLSGNFTIVHV